MAVPRIYYAQAAKLVGQVPRFALGALADEDFRRLPDDEVAGLCFEDDRDRDDRVAGHVAVCHENCSEDERSQHGPGLKKIPDLKSQI